MSAPSPQVSAALAALQARWGAAAPRPLDPSEEPQVVGALATVPLLDREEEPAVDDGRIVGTGFAALDAILGPGGVPRTASVAMHGDASSGKTTLALRLAAEAQAGGAIVAYLDLSRAFDPVEAVARGVRLEWLVVLTPDTLDEGLSIAGALLQGRAVDLLLIDLPTGLRQDDVRPKRMDGGRRTPGVADRLHRLAALARRAGCLLVVLEPPGLPQGVAGAIGESVGLRLELARRSWIRLGRDVIGQRTEVMVARNHFGPPGRRADLRILYADGGQRDLCLTRDPLLREGAPLIALPVADAPDSPRNRPHATPPSALATSPPPPGTATPREGPLRLIPDRSRRPRWPAVDGRTGARHEPGGPRAGHPPRDPAGRRTPVGAGGAVPRP